MNQTKLESLLETSANIATGFIISFLMWSFVVAPLWGIETSAFDNLGIVILFTFTSIARGYIWRRFFNKGLHKLIHRWIKNNEYKKLTNIWIKVNLLNLLSKIGIK